MTATADTAPAVPTAEKTGADRTQHILIALMALIGVVALAAPLLVVLNPPHIAPKPRVVIATRVVPKTELPPVDPVALQAVDETDARAINAAIPFSTEPNFPAAAFRLSGSGDSQGRATDCLAAAVYYEAGDDAVGQRAVAQVVLNRARHPAFPHSVCAVVFQGSERTTGCQFTFTCDGAMIRRRPSEAAWERARTVARNALTGSVYAPVGLATHYHTDWVVPYWSSSLEKISEVHTHLFFRWTGWWGTPPAYRFAYTGTEPNVSKMAVLSPYHRGEPGTVEGEAAPTLGVDPESIPDAIVPEATSVDGNVFIVSLPKGLGSDSFASLAVKTCSERPYCKFMAWADPGKKPASLPLNSAQVAAMSFSYLRDEKLGFAKALWNCGQYPRPSPVQCMRAQPLANPAPTSTPTPAAAASPAGPEPLSGVRRKVELSPAPAPSPTPRPTAAD